MVDAGVNIATQDDVTNFLKKHMEEESNTKKRARS
jgi:hypothetical protein